VFILYEAALAVLRKINVFEGFYRKACGYFSINFVGILFDTFIKAKQAAFT